MNACTRVIVLSYLRKNISEWNLYQSISIHETIYQRKGLTPKTYPSYWQCWYLMQCHRGGCVETWRKNALDDDVIKWKHFPRYWTFVRGIHRSPVNSPHKGQWRGALMFSLIGDWINGWVNNREAGDLRRHCAHYGVIVMRKKCLHTITFPCSDQIGTFGTEIHILYSIHKRNSVGTGPYVWNDLYGDAVWMLSCWCDLCMTSIHGHPLSILQ